MIINDDQVDIISDIPLKGVDIASEITESTQGVIRITNRTNEKYPIPTATLIPRNIVIGIGAKRHTSYKDINKFLNECLRKHHVARKAIGRIASIDLKKRRDRDIRTGGSIRCRICCLYSRGTPSGSPWI